jgi:putative ABC transport system substrate-binding protein
MGLIERRQFLTTAAALLAGATAHAQRYGAVASKEYRLGFLAHGAAEGARNRLVTALGERGWRIGENIALEVGIASSDPARWDAAARSLVDKRCDLIVVLGSHMALVAKRATRTIPIVMMLSGYPVQAGIVTSLAHPGGNITGMRTFTDELPGKFIELARELTPTLRVLGILDDYAPPLFAPGELEAGKQARERAAKALQIESRSWLILSDEDLIRALAEAESVGLDALLVFSGPVNSQPRNAHRIRELVLRRRLPMMTDVAGTAFREGGGVLTYFADWNEIAERTASFVDRILRGARPGELPIEQPTRFELVLNLQNANAIGLPVPPSLLALADRVIN